MSDHHSEGSTKSGKRGLDLHVYIVYNFDMSKSKVITARIDEETFTLVDSIAKAQDRSRASFVARAVKQAAEAEAEFMAFVQVGIDAADRGELIPHELVEAEIDEIIAQNRARKTPDQNEAA